MKLSLRAVLSVPFLHVLPTPVPSTATVDKGQDLPSAWTSWAEPLSQVAEQLVPHFRGETKVLGEVTCPRSPHGTVAEPGF